MKADIKKGIFLAILAAALYAINSPFSKILLAYIPSTLMAGFLYLGSSSDQPLHNTLFHKSTS